MHRGRLTCTGLLQVTPRPPAQTSVTTGSPSVIGSAVRHAEKLQAAKQILRNAILTTNRGGTASSSQRADVLDAQVGVESLSTGIDYGLLQACWQLDYTTAPDVRPLLAAQNPLVPLRVGNIYQDFSSVAEGLVKNVIEFHIPGLLQKGTAEVRATYSVRSPQRIRLTFQEAGVRGIHIAPPLETLLAPAALPRTWLNHRVLLGLREAEVFVPLRARQMLGALAPAERSLERSFGSEYLLTYLDEDTLIGSQTGTGGTFIFSRT